MALRIPIFMLLVLVLISSGFEHASSDQQTNHTSLFSPSASPSPAPVPVPVPVASPQPNPAAEHLPHSSPTRHSSPSHSHSPVHQRRAPHGFCSRVHSRRTCPTPRTRNDFRVENYLGRWYEIGTTAIFKFQHELGLICEHTNHSMLVRHHDDLGAIIAVINRGEPVLGALQTLGISRLSSATEGVCSNARTICSVMAPFSSFDDSLGELASALHSIRKNTIINERPEVADLGREYHDISAMANSIVAEMDTLARDMSRIQDINSNISQGIGNPQGNIDALMDQSSVANERLRSLNIRIAELAANARTQILRDADFLRPESSSLALRLEQSIIAITTELVQVQSHLVQISGTLEGISASSRTMEGAPTPRIIDWPTTEVRGIAIQNPDAHGKLQINQYGGVSPYWILDLERSSRGGYNAALVYSCLEGQDGQPRENLFVLSRLRSLSRAVVDRFMETARRNGIYTDCENPFVHTLQREGVCGWPYP